MSEAMQAQLPTLLWSIAAGTALGVLFFCRILWKRPDSFLPNNAAIWLISSLASRFFMVLAGFYLVFDGVWLRLAACAIGFAIGFILVRGMTGKGIAPLLRERRSARRISSN